MSVVFGLLQYVIAVSMLLVITGVVGLSIILIFSAKSSVASTDFLLLSPVLGLSAISMSSLFFASHGFGVNTKLLWVIVVLIATSALLRQRWLAGTVKFPSGVNSSLKISVFLICASIVGLAPYLQLFINSRFPTGFGTSASWTNNDLGAYIQMATNVIKSGHRDAGFVDGWNAGLQASFDHPAAQSLYASLSQTLFRQPFQMGIVVMATVLSSLFFATIVVARNLTQRASSMVVMFSIAFVVVNPALVAATANFFFAQILAVALTMGVFAYALVLVQEEHSVVVYLPLTILSIAVVFTSIEISVVMVPLVLLFALMTAPRKILAQQVLKISVTHLGSLAVVTVLLFKILNSQINVLRRTTIGGVAGWTSNYTSVTALVGMAPTQLGGPYSQGVRTLDFLIIGVFLIVVLRLIKSRVINLAALLSVILLTLLLVVAFAKWGVSGYQTWKLISTVFPFFGILIWSINGSRESSNQLGTRGVISLLMMGATLSWSGYIWKDAQLSSFINPDVAEVALSESAHRQDGINILLAPFFETMAVSAMTGIRSNMSSPTYQFSSGQGLTYGCTITTVDKVGAIVNAGPIVHQRGNYVLVGSPKCK